MRGWGGVGAEALKDTETTPGMRGGGGVGLCCYDEGTRTGPHCYIKGSVPAPCRYDEGSGAATSQYGERSGELGLRQYDPRSGPAQR